MPQNEAGPETDLARLYPLAEAVASIKDAAEKQSSVTPSEATYFILQLRQTYELCLEALGPSDRADLEKLVGDVLSPDAPPLNLAASLQCCPP